MRKKKEPFGYTIARGNHPKALSVSIKTWVCFNVHRTCNLISKFTANVNLIDDDYCVISLSIQDPSSKLETFRYRNTWHCTTMKDMQMNVAWLVVWCWSSSRIDLPRFFSRFFFVAVHLKLCVYKLMQSRRYIQLRICDMYIVVMQCAWRQRHDTSEAIK